jgi:hypothetical protein
MICIFYHAAMAHVLTLDLTPQLRRLLERRFANLATPWGDLTDFTEWIILEPGDTEEDICREVGFSPFIEPLEGARWGTAGFRPFWDYLAREDEHFVMIQSFGSSFAYVLMVPEAEGIMPDLLRLCREYAA